MSKVEVGDRVRVFFDGVVKSTNPTHRFSVRYDGEHEDSFPPPDAKVEVIEKRKLKVGDEIHGMSARSLPVGTVLFHGLTGHYFFRSSADAWSWSGCNDLPWVEAWTTTIVYIPD